MFSIIVNDVQYYDFSDADVEQYLQANIEGISIHYYDRRIQTSVLDFKQCFCVISVCSWNDISIVYNESEKSKIQPIIDCIKKWDYCITKNSFVVERELYQPIEFHHFNRYAHLNHCTMICTGFRDKQYYIEHFNSCSIT